MHKILNRLAWFASVGVGCLVSSIVDNGEINFFLALVLSVIFKMSFFSNSFIKESLRDGKLKKRNNAYLEEEHVKLTKDDIRDDKNLVLEHAVDPLGNILSRMSGKAKIEEESVNDSKIGESAEDVIEKTRMNVAAASETMPYPHTVLKTSGSVRDSSDLEAKLEESSDNYELERERISSEPGFLQKFFAENALAKVGGILLFLGVLFLLKLVYAEIGPIGKLLIGFMIAFVIFSVGLFLDKKGLKKESRILFGTAILINYLVILSGRYLIGENALRDESLTFFMLILNTIFAISVSLAYASHSLLFFSFVAAYLNPFFIGLDFFETPYTITAYALLVSMGAIAVSYFYKDKRKVYSFNLLTTAFVGGNILLFFAPMELESYWMIKLIAIAFLALLSICVAYLNGQKQGMSFYFVGAYVSFVILLAEGSYYLSTAFNSFEITLAYLLFMALMIGASVVIFTLTSVASVFYFLAAPLVILVGLILTETLYIGDISWVLIVTMIAYLGIFVKLFKTLNVGMKYGLFAGLGGFIFLVSGYFSNLVHGFGVNTALYQSLINSQIYGMIVVSFIFLFSAYYFSTKKGLEYLYSIGTLFGIFTLIPVLLREGELRAPSVISVVVLTASAAILPFVNKRLIDRNIKNLIIGLVASLIFAVGGLFYFMFGDRGQSTVTLGISFLMLAVIYFFLSFLMYEKIKHSLVSNKEDDNSQASNGMNIIYTFIGASISLFSLSIAYIFSENSEVVSAIWLFESALMFFIYRKARDFKVFIVGIILMFIGILKLVGLFDAISERDYFSFIPLLIIYASLIVSMKFIDFVKSEIRNIYDALHVIGLFLILFLILDIIPNHSHGWAVLGAAVFSIISAVAYSAIYSGKIKHAFVVVLSGIFLYQVGGLDYTFRRLGDSEFEYLKILQHLSTLLLFYCVLVFKYLSRKAGNQFKESRFLYSVLSLVSSLYLFVITTQYVYHFFEKNEFWITIYWGILAFTYLNYGIQKNFIKYRTIGLYILTLTIGKILFYDIWSSLNDAIMRVVALILVGSLMIVISMLYSKKYDNNLKGEFDLENLVKSDK